MCEHRVSATGAHCNRSGDAGIRYSAFGIRRSVFSVRNSLSEDRTPSPEHRFRIPAVFGVRYSALGTAYPKTEDRVPNTDSGWRRGGGKRLAREVASGELPRHVLDERRHDLAADRELRDRAARVEDAAARRIEWRRDVAGQDDPALLDGRV